MLSSAHGAIVVLYVDDEEMARKYVERTFSATYKVLTAADAESAWRIVEDPQMQVGIVVSDYRMPGQSGGELLRRIAEKFPHIIRMLVTAYADREVLLETVNTGEVFRILEKPLDREEFRKALSIASDLLRMRGARSQRLQAIDETLSFLAHELNTPLATILNFARGLQERTAAAGDPMPADELLKASKAISDNASYCLTALSSFVDTVRSAGALRTGAQGTSAHELILSFLDTYPMTAAQRAIVHTELEQDFQISGLPSFISLILSSLLNNALRALQDIPSPSITLTVSSGERPFIRICDNGPGIPPEILARLTVDPVTTYSGSGGSGWGLIFCKRIMLTFGGRIEIESEPNVCTAITLIFPPGPTRGTDTTGAHPTAPS